MKKIILLAFLSASLSLSAQDPSAPDLQQIITTAKSAYTKVETLDKLRQDLKYFDEHPATGNDQQQQLLEAYRSIVNGYSANNHFKQGYGVYQKYLEMKENLLAADKAAAIATTNKNIEEKQSEDIAELASLQNGVKQLEADNENMQSKRKSFKHYFSVIIIVLTAIFAFLLLQAGLKFNKLKHDLKAGRERLMAIHRISVLGKLKNGIILTVNTIFPSIKKLASESSKEIDELGKQQGEKITEISALRKKLNELSNLPE